MRIPSLLLTNLVICAAILVICLVVAVMTSEPPAVLGMPRCASRIAAAGAPSLPPVGDFAAIYNTTSDNPFLYNAKPIQVPGIGQGQDTAQKKPGIGGKGSGDAGMKPLPPTLVLPAAHAHHADAPVCHGLLAVGSVTCALVTVPGDARLRQMAVGDTISDAGNPGHAWTLIGLEAGNLARWRDPEGNVAIYPIARKDRAAD
jgi:hypothetical protein